MAKNCLEKLSETLATRDPTWRLFKQSRNDSSRRKPREKATFGDTNLLTEIGRQVASDAGAQSGRELVIKTATNMKNPEIFWMGSNEAKELKKWT